VKEIIRSTWIAGAVVASLTAVVSAQGPPVSAPALSLQQVLDEALARNPDLIMLAREHERARLEPDTARAFEPPMFEAQIWRWPIDTLNPSRTDMYMFSIGQTLPGRGKREAMAAVAEADAAVAGASIAVRARQIIDQVKQAWADVFLVRRALATNTGTLALLRQFTDIAAAKYATGRAPQQDVLAGVVELSRVHEQLTRLREDEQLATARLNVLMGRRPEAPVELEAELVDVAVLPSTTDLQAVALEHEPGLRVASLEVDRARAALAAAITDYKPDVTIGGGYMLMPNDTDAWMARVSVTWPGAPWSRGRLDAKKAVAAAEISTREARRQAAENDVRLAVHGAWVRADGAGARVALLESSILPQARQAVEVARAAYESDRGSFLALVDSQRVRLDAELDFHRARAERAQALADLERVAGIDLATVAAREFAAAGGR